MRIKYDGTCHTYDDTCHHIYDDAMMKINTLYKLKI